MTKTAEKFPKKKHSVHYCRKSKGDSSMTIIDAHAHWYRRDIIWPEDHWKFVITSFSALSGGKYSEDEMEGLLCDEDGSNLIKTMDEAGIDKTVILPVDFGILYEEPPIDYMGMNKLYSELAKQYPDRIFTYFGIDPRRDKAAYIFEKAIGEYGNIKGLKIYPPCGFSPSEAILDNLYAVCEKHNLPVVTHGCESAYNEIQYGAPEYLLDVLKRRPKLKLVYAHVGWNQFFEGAVNLLRDYENVYADISGWQTFSDEDIIEKLEYIDKKVGSTDKIMFGTDAPNFDIFVPAKPWVERVAALKLPDDVKKKLLSETAAELHNI
jgi:predicted TIM-barrel fold metal-dependent hydrolase